MPLKHQTQDCRKLFSNLQFSILKRNERSFTRQYWSKDT